ncbi:MAG: helix-turn-helix transcriptional regulator [Acidaminococcaceae bacterium]
MPNEDKIREVFTKKLNRFLQIKSVTQLELAKHMNVSNTTINNWVKGYKMPRMDKIDAICTFFNINRSDLLEDAQDPTPAPTLPQAEENLLTDYRKLNNTGKRKAAEYVSDLTDTEKYTVLEQDEAKDVG